MRHLYQKSMMFLLVFFLVAFAPAPVSGRQACMTIDQARVVQTTENVIDFHKAVKNARAFRSGEVISAKLCRVDHRIMYVLTVMTADSRVIRVAVDAHSGTVQELN